MKNIVLLIILISASSAQAKFIGCPYFSTDNLADLTNNFTVNVSLEKPLTIDGNKLVADDNHHSADYFELRMKKQDEQPRRVKRFKVSSISTGIIDEYFKMAYFQADESSQVEELILSNFSNLKERTDITIICEPKAVVDVALQLYRSLKNHECLSTQDV